MEEEEKEDKILELKEKGETSKEIADKLDMSLEEVNNYYQKQISVQKMRIGHFEKLLTKKTGENGNLNETQKALAMNIKALWKMISLLESRKKQLENIINDMEKYIIKGSEVADIFLLDDENK